MDWKYIVIDCYIGGPTLFPFPPYITHFEFNRIVNRKKEKILSAGFIRRRFEGTTTGNHCYGRSETLKVKSNPDIDNVLLDRMLFERY